MLELKYRSHASITRTLRPSRRLQSADDGKSDGDVQGWKKISVTQGGFDGVLQELDVFGRAVTTLGDLDKDGIDDMAVGAQHDNDGGSNRGAVWILFLHSNRTVKGH